MSSSSKDPFNWDKDDSLKAEVWLAHEALKPMCDALSKHRGEIREDNEILLSRLSVLRDELKQLPPRGVQMCAILLAPHLIGLLQWYTVSKNVLMKDQSDATIDMVLESLLLSILVLLEVIERVDAPFCDSLLTAIAKLLTPPERPRTPPSSSALILENSWESTSLFANFSEEIRRDISRILSTSLAKLSEPSLTLIKQPKTHTSLFFILSQLLEIALRDRNRENQAHALKAAQQIASLNIGPAPISSVLPGILSTCGRIILGDYKQGQDVFVQAFKLISTAVVTAMNDEENSTLESETSFDGESALERLRSLQQAMSKKTSSVYTDTPPSLTSPAKKKDEKPTLPSAQRDANWFKNAAYHVHLMLSRLFAVSRLTSDETSRNISMSTIIVKSAPVRLEMARSAASILSRCRRTLVTTLPSLFEILVLLSFDDHHEISDFCEAQLKANTAFFGVFEQRQLRTLLAENLGKLVAALPRIMRDPEDNKKLLVLRLTAGYVRILGKSFQSTLPALCFALTNLLELESNDIKLTHRKTNMLLLESGVEDAYGKSGPKNDLAKLALHEIQQTYRRNFVHFRDDKVLSAIIGIARHLGAYNDVELIFDQLMPVISQATTATLDDDDLPRPSSMLAAVPAAMLLLNEVMLGASGLVDLASGDRIKLSRQKQSQLKGQWEHFLSFYTGEELWNRSTEAQGDDFSSMTPFDIHKWTLLLEGIGNMSMVFGSSFNAHIRKPLYQILQLAGSQFSVVSFVAKLTLVRLSIHTGTASGDSDSVLNLINANMDFVVDSIVHELRYTQNLDGALRVLHGILKLSSQLMVPLLSDLIDDIFRGLDQRHERYNQAFLSILHGVVSVVSQQPHRSRAEIRAENALRRAKKQARREPKDSKEAKPDSVSSSKVQIPSTTPSSKNIEEVEDYTLHNWIRRCDLNYTRRRPIQSSNKDDTEVSYEEEELGHVSASMVTGESSTQIGTERDQLGFGVRAFLNSRIKRRINEAEVFKNLSNDKSGSGDGPMTAEEYFTEHHRKKQEEESRGDDLHKGEEQGTDEDAEADEDSDEEFESTESDEEDISTDGASKPRPASLIKRKKKPHRPGYDFVHQILLRLQHWMSIRDLEARTIVLETVRVGISIIAEHKKVLLPTIHSLWSPLQWRFLDTDYRIANKSLDIMTTMARYGKSFVTRRFLDDLWPLLKQMMALYNVHTPAGEKNIAKTNIATQYSQFADAETAFKMSQSFKIQNAALQCVLSALTHLKLPLPILLEIGDTCWFYLSEMQPPVLQEAACKLFSVLLDLEPNTTWLLLVELSHATTSVPKHVEQYLKQSPYPPLSLPRLEPLVTVAPEKFRKSALTLSNFYSQFSKNVISVIV